MKHLFCSFLFVLFFYTVQANTCPISGVSVTSVTCNTTHGFVDFNVNFTTTGSGEVSVFLGNDLIGSGTSSPIACSVHRPLATGLKTIRLGHNFGDCASATYTHPACATYSPNADDPCSCDDPLNRKNAQGIVTHFHDVLRVRGNPGENVVLTSSGPYFLDNNLAQVSNGTTLGAIPASGIFTYDFFHASGPTGNISLTAGGVTVNPDPLAISVCNASDCVVDPIPTMSQWGTMIFFLLIVNLGLFTLKQKEQLIA